ncbi:MAG: hypothetical protein KAJ62_10210 [Desulfobacteraceae bacterium]|nr:hypothetical protein [Desulfobacteraceae bacterium]
MKSSIMLSTLICGLLLVTGGSANELSEIKYYIELSTNQISKHEVKFNIKTNIPLPVEVMASIDLKNQKPDDVYIGYSKKIRIKDSTQSFILNTKSENLPSSKYDTEVAFYPFWGADNGNPKAIKIKNSIHGLSEILLQGIKNTAHDMQQKNNMQRWVMLNVVMGTPWDEVKFINKLGSYEEILVTNRNSKIIKAYYFSDAEMTVFVNAYKTTVTTWRKGKTSNE